MVFCTTNAFIIENVHLSELVSALYILDVPSFCDMLLICTMP
jgi:hypothetical protein